MSYYQTSNKRLLGLVYLGLIFVSSIFFGEVKAAWYDNNWDYRVPITIESDNVNGDLTDFAVFIDLSDLSSTDFFTNIKDAGEDLRVTKSDGTELAFDLVSIDTLAQTGELHFKVSGILSGSTDTTFYLYYGNNGAAAYADDDTYGAENVWNTYTAVWHFSEDPTGAGTRQLKDYSPNSNDGYTQNFAGSALQSGAKMGDYYVFDGTNDFIAINDLNYTSTGDITSMTVTGWYRSTFTHTNYNRNWAIIDFDRSEHFDFYQHGDGRLSFSGRDDAGILDFFSTGTTVNDGAWHQVAVTYNGTTVDVFVDGIVRDSDSSVWSFGIGRNTTRYGFIGDGSEAGSFNAGRNNIYMEADLDELRLDDSAARSREWIWTEYQNQNSPATFYSVGSQEALTRAWLGGGAAWEYRIQINVDSAQVNGSHTDFPLYYDLADLSATNFFTQVQSNGSDLRVTTADGLTEVPIEVVDIDTGGSTGEIHFKAPTLSGGEKFYIYYGNGDAAAYANGDTYGMHNVWSNNYLAVWHMNENPGSANIDDSSTSNYSGSPEGSMTGGDLITAGQVGKSIDFDGSNDALNFGSGLSGDFSGQSFSFSAWDKRGTNTTNDFLIGRNVSGPTGQHLHIGYRATDQYTLGFWGNDLDSTGTHTTSVWRHWYSTYDTTIDQQKLFLNGLPDNERTSTGDVTGSDTYYIARAAGTDYFDGEIDEVRFSSVVRDDAWIDTEYNNQNNPTTFFTTSAEEFNPAAIPWFDGDWLRRIKITIDSTLVDADLTNFPIYVDLSDFTSTDLFTHSKNNGGDIRMANANGDQLAAELVSFDNGTNTGELHFVANGTLSSTVDTDFYLYYDNPGASVLAETDTYGANNVWINNYLAVWHMDDDPSGSAPQLLDSTSRSVDGTSTGSMTGADVVAGKFGNAMDMDGTDDNFSIADTTIEASLPATNDFTISGWVYQHSSASYDTMMGWNNPWMLIAPQHTATQARIYWEGVLFDVTTGSNLNSWHYHTFTSYSSTDHRYNIDGGADIGTSSAVRPGSIYTDFYLGSYSPTNGEIDGLLDELRVSGVARSPEWISTEYNNQNTPATFYSLEETTSPNIELEILSSIPPDNGAAITIDWTTNNMSILFNQPVDIVAGAELRIKKLSTNGVIQTIDLNTAAVTGNGTTDITIDTDFSLEYGTDYFVEINNGGLTNVQGNAFSGISDNGTWNFTTQAWLTGFNHRIPITVNGDEVKANINNFPVYFDLNLLDGSNFFDRVKSDGSDLRVTDYSGDTELPFELVKLDTTNNGGELHFKVDGTLFFGSDTTFYLYYGNGDASAYARTDTYGSDNVWTENYRAVYHFAESPTSAVLDSTANANDGTSAGSMTNSDLIAGQVGNGLTFDGTDDRIDISYDASLNLSAADAYAISYWFNTPDSTRQYIVDQQQAGFAGYYSIVDQPNTVMSMPNGSTWNETTVNVSSSLSTDHYSYTTWDGSQLRAYLDGAFISQTAVSGSLSSSTQPLALAATNAGAQEYQGMLDEIRISDYPRTVEWIETEYNNQNSPSNFWSVGDREDLVVSIELLTRTPADNSIGVLPDANLTLEFNTEVDIQAGGNLTIYDAADDSVHEIITLNSGLVTGNGTDTLTINPSVDFLYGESYYVNISAGAINDSTNSVSYGGISDKVEWNFSTPSWLDGFRFRMRVTAEGTLIAGDVDNFPLYFDLNRLDGTNFFDYVQSNGSDLRVTKADGSTELPIELITIDTSGNGGELYFKASGDNGLVSATDTSFYFYFGNGDAALYGETDTFGSQNVWSNGYLAVWHMNQDPSGSSPQLVDSTSRDIDATSAGSMTLGDLVTGKIGNAIDFDGSDDYFSITDTEIEVNLPPTNNFTISGWTYQHSSGNYESIMAWDTPWLIMAPQHTATDAHIYWEGALISINTGSNLNGWHYHTFTSYSATDHRYNIDGGANIGTSSANEPSGTYSQFYIGSYSPTNGRMDGLLDELRVSNVARSPEWIETEYNNQNNPVSFWSSVGSIEDSLVNLSIIERTPPDNGVGVDADTNIVMTFNTEVDVQTGNLTVYDADGDTVHEVIDLATGAVTGNGTATITINPSVDLLFEKDYYIEIDAATFVDDITGTVSFAGITDHTVWNFSTADWLTGFNYRIEISTNGDLVNGNLTDYPAYFDLNLLDGTDFFDDVKADGSDIRITSADGTTELPYELVSLDTSGNGGELHFKAQGVNGVTLGVDTDFYIYYGNGDAVAYANGDTYGSDNVWTNSYVAVWHMDEDPSAGAKSILDSSGSDYHADPNGTMTAGDLVTGQLGNALDFDSGTNDYLDIDSFTENFTTGLTISAWVDHDAHNNWSRVMDFGNSSASDNILIANSGATSNVAFEVYTGASSGGSIITAGWNTSAWQKVDATIAVGNAATVYLDGGSIGTGTVSLPSTLTRSSNYIARSNWGADAYLDGRIDELRISTLARSADWILTEYKNQSNVTNFWSVAAVESNITDITAIAFTPPDNGTAASVIADLQIQFDSVPSVNNGNILIRNQYDDSIFMTLDTNNGNVFSVTGNNLDIMLPSPLFYNTNYYVEIDSNAINNYPGFTDNGTWNFYSGQMLYDLNFFDKMF